MVMVNINGKQVYLDANLKQKLDNVSGIIKKNWDFVGLYDGFERSGKSTLAMTSAAYLHPGFSIKNVAVGAQDAVDKIEVLPDKSLLVIDEGSLVFSSRDAMKKEQRKIMKILDVCGQKNLILLIVLPSFFELNRAIATRRSRFLVHVYTDKVLNRGRFAYFGQRKKNLLYEIGKKNFNSYARPQSDFIGRFTDSNPLGQEYFDLKKKSLMEALHTDDIAEAPKLRQTTIQRDVAMYQLNTKFNLKQREIAELFEKYKVGLSRRAVGNCIERIRDIGEGEG